MTQKPRKINSMKNLITNKVLFVTLLLITACGEDKTTASTNAKSTAKSVELKTEEKSIEEKLIDGYFQQIDKCIRDFDPVLVNTKRSELSEEKRALYKSVKNDCIFNQDAEFDTKINKIAKSYKTTVDAIFEDYFNKHPEAKEKYIDKK